MQRQIKPVLEIITIENLLIENSKHYSYGIGNSVRLCKLNKKRKTK